jgi:predicted alpha/beta-fold hydrolase
MITLAKLKKLNTIEDLEGSGLIGELDIEISHRGGHLGYLGQDVAQSLGINWGLLPRKVGAYVNYLGGGCKNLSGIVGNN